MNLKKIITSSILLAIGLILHQITPPILFGMKPDILLSMMFISILLNDDYKLTLLVGLTAGILTALTTDFPGGQIPNIIDKLVTCNAVYLMIKLTPKVHNQVRMTIISLIGTLISGAVFLGSAALLVGLPHSASFTTLMLAVVLPATIVNTIAGAVLYNSAGIAARTVNSR